MIYTFCQDSVQCEWVYTVHCKEFTKTAFALQNFCYYTGLQFTETPPTFLVIAKGDDLDISCECDEEGASVSWYYKVHPSSPEFMIMEVLFKL